MMRYALWLLVLSVLALCALAYLMRRRRKRRDDPRYHIPTFLSGRPYPSDNPSRAVDVDVPVACYFPGRHRKD
jgi:hypothetical protein